jgi:hypothetical protein
VRAAGLLSVVALIGLGAAACGGDRAAAGSPLAPVGLTAEAAGELAENQGFSWRIIEEDGQRLAVTADFMPERLNFVVEDGVVVSARSDAELSGG